MMAKLSWNKIETELRSMSPEIKVPEQESFWREFRAKSGELEPQTDRGFAVLRPSFWLRAAAIVVVMCVVLYTIRSSDQESPIAGNRIKEIEVFASYSAMVIMDTNQSEGTFVWITDMDDQIN